MKRNDFYVMNVSTFPPRRCGIGSFAKDQLENLGTNNWVTCPIVREIGATKYSSKHKLHIGKEIDQENPASYDECARYIVEYARDLRAEGKDLGCFINHEYGIFPDDSAVRLLRILKQGNVATFVVGHTILYNKGRADFPERSGIMVSMLNNCDKFACLTRSAVDVLSDDDKYGAPRGKLIYIAHGIPEIEIPEKRAELKRKYRFVNKKGREKTIFTSVGFLSSNKGIEYIIKGFSSVLKSRKDKDNLVYLIAEGTHPEVLKYEGEVYRESLVRSAIDEEIPGVIITREESRDGAGKKLKIRDLEGREVDSIGWANIVFLNTHLEDYELLEIMKMSDFGVIGNLDEDQISSGPGAYWIGSSRITIATESNFFKDMEAEGIGLLVPFRDSKAFEDCMNYVLNLHPKDKDDLEFIASDFGAKNTWAIQGEVYLNVMRKIVMHKAGLRNGSD